MLTRRPTRTLNLNSFVPSGSTEIQGRRHKWCGTLGPDVPTPRTLSRIAEANLDCASVEKALVFIDPKIGPWPSLPDSSLILFICKKATCEKRYSVIFPSLEMHQ